MVSIYLDCCFVDFVLFFIGSGFQQENMFQGIFMKNNKMGLLFV